jgi:hypothetical protein
MGFLPVSGLVPPPMRISSWEEPEAQVGEVSSSPPPAGIDLLTCWGSSHFLDDPHFGVADIESVLDSSVESVDIQLHEPSSSCINLDHIASGIPACLPDDPADPISLDLAVPAGDDSCPAVPPPCTCCDLPLGSCSNFIDHRLELIFQVHNSGVPNQDSLRVPIPSSLHSVAWATHLHNYWDLLPIMEGIVYGWDIGVVGPATPSSATRNHPSAVEHIDDVRAYVAEELAHGALLGPLKRHLLPFKVAVTPLGAVPKLNSARRRIITDCSFSGKGINAWIPKQWYRGQPWKIRLPTVDDIAAAIVQCQLKFPGEPIVGFKIDLARYFRNIGIDPGQSVFLAIIVDSNLYLDLVHSFGNRGAMVAAQRLADAIAWIFRTQLPPEPGVINSGINCRCSGPCGCGDNILFPYVDDFIGVCPERLGDFLWLSLLKLLSELGLRPSATPGHLVPPCRIFTGLGIQFDICANTISIPAPKLGEIAALLQFWHFKLEANLHELQSLLGKLLFVCKVVRSGRLMVSRMLDTLRLCYTRRAVVTLDENFRLDLLWWSDNLVPWNGISYLQFSDQTFTVTLDASSDGAPGGGPGIGGFDWTSNQWFKCSPPPHMLDWPIADYELLAHIIACRLWGPSWRGKKIWGKTDSEPCEFLLRHGRSRINRRLAMARAVATLEHRLDFMWISAPIRSKENVLADCASRWRDPERRHTFWQTCVDLHIAPVEVIVSPEMFVF